MPNAHPAVPDRGPWSVHKREDGQVVLASDDFNHDAQLLLSGDFADSAQRLAYGQYLARVLTTVCAREQALHEMPDPGRMLASLLKAGESPAGDLLLLAADEIARLRVALAQADQALEQLQARKHLRHNVQQAAVPSAFALALQQALGRTEAQTKGP